MVSVIIGIFIVIGHCHITYETFTFVDVSTVCVVIASEVSTLDLWAVFGIENVKPPSMSERTTIGIDIPLRKATITFKQCRGTKAEATYMVCQVEATFTSVGPSQQDLKHVITNQKSYKFLKKNESYEIVLFNSTK